MKKFNRLTSILLVIVMLFEFSACGKLSNIKETASNIAENAVNTAKNGLNNTKDFASEAADNIKDKLSKLSMTDFKKGWDVTTGFFSANLAAFAGSTYVSNVASKIEALQNNINTRAQNYANSKNLSSIAGYVAEEWHAGTFNIDAVAKAIKNVAKTGKRNDLGSADISTNNFDASVKFWKTANDSAKQQAESYMQRFKEYQGKGGPKDLNQWLAENATNLDEHSELFWSIYKDQVRIIPADQLKDAQSFLKKAIEKEAKKTGENRAFVQQNYEQTLSKLRDRLQAADGTQSIPLTKDEAEAIAALAKEGDYKPSDFSKSITLDSSIKASYIAKQAIKSGVTSAVIETAIVVGPEIYEIIKYLIETGELDEEQIKKTGIDTLSSSADGFLKGSISNALIVMCQAGKLGSEYANPSPEFIGTLTVVVIDAIKYGIKLSKGEITTLDYADYLAREVAVSVGSLGSAALIGMFFPTAAVAILVGSFIGGLIVSSGYQVGKICTLALIESANMTILVPIQAKAEILKGKTETAKESLKDALANLKDLPKKTKNTITIKVYDLTSNIKLASK